MSKKSVKQVRRKHSDEFRRNGVTDNTYYRWRKEFGGIRTDQAKRLKELEKENYPTEQSFAGAQAQEVVVRLSMSLYRMEHILRSTSQDEYNYQRHN